MKIIDKTRPATGEVIDYDFGDVIKYDKDLYTLITGEQDGIGVFSLTSLRVEAWYDNIGDVEDAFDLSRGQLVKATLMIE